MDSIESISLGVKKVLDVSPLPMFVLDDASNVMYANDSWYNVFQLSKEDDPNMWLYGVRSDSRAAFVGLWQELTANKRNLIDLEMNTESKTMVLMAYKQDGRLFTCILIDMTVYKQRWTKSSVTIKRQLDWSEQIRRQQNLYIKLITYHLKEPTVANQNESGEFDLSVIKDGLKSLLDKMQDFEKNRLLSRNVDYNDILKDITMLSNLDLKHIELNEKVFALKDEIDTGFVKLVSIIQRTSKISEETIVNADLGRLHSLIMYLIRTVEMLKNPKHMEIQVLDEYNNDTETLHLVVQYEGTILNELQINLLRNSLSELTLNSLSLDEDINTLLFLMKSLTEILEGYVNFTCTDNLCKFEVQVSLKLSNTKPVYKPTNGRAQITRKLNVLITEDNMLLRMIAEKDLKKLGHTVYAALNGKEAIEIYKSKPIDLILMDIEMPEVNGIEATRKIREIEQEQKVEKKIPIIIITGYKTKDYQNKAMEVGATEFLTKPFKYKEVLSRAYERYLE